MGQIVFQSKNKIIILKCKISSNLVNKITNIPFEKIKSESVWCMEYVLNWFQERLAVGKVRKNCIAEDERNRSNSNQVLDDYKHVEVYPTINIQTKYSCKVNYKKVCYRSIRIESSHCRLKNRASIEQNSFQSTILIHEIKDTNQQRIYLHKASRAHCCFIYLQYQVGRW